jgi:hypothetical protein
MTSIEVPHVTARPECLDRTGGHGNIIECVSYFINLLISHAPAELTAEFSPDRKTAVWSVFSLPGKVLVHTEQIKAIWFRPFLARIGNTYMISSGRSYSAAFYLGNDGLCGFWFKGICGNHIEPEIPKDADI